MRPTRGSSREKYREKQKLEWERTVKEKKKANAERMLDEASDLAYLEEIRRGQGLLKYLDPTYTSPEKDPLVADKGLAPRPNAQLTART